MRYEKNRYVIGDDDNITAELSWEGVTLLIKTPEGKCLELIMSRTTFEYMKRKMVQTFTRCKNMINTRKGRELVKQMIEREKLVKESAADRRKFEARERARQARELMEGLK